MPKEETGSSDQDNTNAKSPDESPPAVGFATIVTPQDNTEHSTTTQDDSESEIGKATPLKSTFSGVLSELNISGVVQTAATVVIALFTIIYTIYSCKQWKAMDGQLHTMQDQVAVSASGAQAAILAAQAASGALIESRISRDASEKQSKAALDTSIGIAQNEERAWIVAKAGVDPIRFGINDRILMPFHIVNMGKTPAFRVGAYVRVEFLETGHTPSFAYPKGTSMRYTNGEMIPGQDEVRDIPARNNSQDIVLNQSDIAAIFAGKRYAAIYSDITYWDSGDRGHWTRFCVELNLGPIKTDTDPSDGCTEYNRAGNGKLRIKAN